MMTRILSVNPEKICLKNIKYAAELIRKGGLVAFPTETVYGLGANAFDAYAVARIFEVKKRPRFDPIIVHIFSRKDIKNICFDVDERANMLMDRFWPGPLTLLFSKLDHVPDIVTAGLPTVAVRMPAHPVARELIKEARTPIAAPSANPFGYLSPTTSHHVVEQLGEKVDVILDGGPCPLGIESTVLDVTETKPVLLRPGGLPIEEIESVIGEVTLSSSSKKPHSPGQLPCHYAPKTPIRILHKNKRIQTGKRIGLLAFTDPKMQEQYEMVEVLSSKGDLHEAAANLFSCLHRLDQAGLDVIYAEAIEETGLGRAIMDRLHRASAKRSSVSSI